MEKEFIPYEQAVKLKELGFDEPCLAYWGEINGGEVELFLKSNYDTEAYYILAPLYQQVLRWFREKYFINTYFHFKLNIKKWDFITYDTNFNGIEYVKYYNKYYKKNQYRSFDTYEEAQLYAIKELINLIKS